jgi:hypothetical protein
MRWSTFNSGVLVLSVLNPSLPIMGNKARPFL